MKANDREKIVVYLCQYEGECSVYKQGKCVCEEMVFGRNIECPHSRRICKVGVTKRAKSFGELSRRWRQMYKTNITTSNEFLCECGDYIYLPLPYLDICTGKACEEIVNGRFIKKDDFDIIRLHFLITYIPRAIMGGEIEDYQKNHIPKFIRQLKCVFPSLYNEYLEKYPKMKEKFLEAVGNSVGRKAYLNTLNDGAKFIDCHKNEWVKDGEWLICNGYKTWLAVGDKPRKCMQQIIGDEIIPVLSNDDVSDGTKFVN